MATCNSCPWSLCDESGDLLPEHRGKAWADLPCANCELAHSWDVTKDNDRVSKGNTVVSSDATKHEAHEYGAKAVEPDIYFDEKVDDSRLDRMATLRAMALTADVLRALYQMEDPTTREIIMQRMSGETFKAIGENVGMQMHAVHWRFRSAAKKWPALDALFPFNCQPPGQRRKRIPKALRETA